MTAAISTHGLCRDYGPVRAVIDLDLVVEPGQVFAFLGPNGAGKTTTIRMLLALQRPTSGWAEVLGLDRGRDYVEIHRRTGHLPGELALYPRMTGRQQIAWYAGARGLRDLSLARALAERFDAVLDRPAREQGRLVATETVENLRASTPQTVQARFARPVDPALFAGIRRVSVTACDGVAVQLRVTGAIGPVLRVVADHDPVDFTAQHADLDGLFLDYYREPAAPEPSHAS